MPKIWKDVQGYGMKGNNFVSYSFLLFITLFFGLYGLLDHSGNCDPSPMAQKCFRVSWRKFRLGYC